jgi:hypothetical protein
MDRLLLRTYAKGSLLVSQMPILSISHNAYCCLQAVLPAEFNILKGANPPPVFLLNILSHPKPMKDSIFDLHPCFDLETGNESVSKPIVAFK